ncbi:unnamed protein product, partial [Rotaria sordida]
PYDVKLEKTFSKMTDDEKRLMIEKVKIKMNIYLFESLISDI